MSDRSGKKWASRSAATLARRLRRERAANCLLQVAADATAKMPVAELSAVELNCLQHIMLDVGMAKLDHWALDSHNGRHCHNHGEAIDRAAHNLPPDLLHDLCYVKARGDAARHCAGPPLGFTARPSFFDRDEIITRLDTLGAMVASLQLGQRSAECTVQQESSLDPSATPFFFCADGKESPERNVAHADTITSSAATGACEKGYRPFSALSACEPPPAEHRGSIEFVQTDSPRDLQASRNSEEAPYKVLANTNGKSPVLAGGPTTSACEKASQQATETVIHGSLAAKPARKRGEGTGATADSSMEEIIQNLFDEAGENVVGGHNSAVGTSEDASGGENTISVNAAISACGSVGGESNTIPYKAAPSACEHVAGGSTPSSAVSPCVDVVSGINAIPFNAAINACESVKRGSNTSNARLRHQNAMLAAQGVTSQQCTKSALLAECTAMLGSWRRRGSATLDSPLQHCDADVAALYLRLCVTTGTAPHKQFVLGTKAYTIFLCKELKPFVP